MGTADLLDGAKAERPPRVDVVRAALAKAKARAPPGEADAAQRAVAVGLAEIKVEEISLATFNSSVGIHTSPIKVEGMDDIDDEEDEDGNPKAKKKAGKGGKQAKKEEAVYYRVSVKAMHSLD